MIEIFIKENSKINVLVNLLLENSSNRFNLEQNNEFRKWIDEIRDNEYLNYIGIIKKIIDNNDYCIFIYPKTIISDKDAISKKELLLEFFESCFKEINRKYDKIYEKDLLDRSSGKEYDNYLNSVFFDKNIIEVYGYFLNQISFYISNYEKTDKLNNLDFSNNMSTRINLLKTIKEIDKTKIYKNEEVEKFSKEIPEIIYNQLQFVLKNKFYNNIVIAKKIKSIMSRLKNNFNISLKLSLQNFNLLEESKIKHLFKEHKKLYEYLKMLIFGFDIEENGQKIFYMNENVILYKGFFIFELVVEKKLKNEYQQYDISCLNKKSFKYEYELKEYKTENDISKQKLSIIPDFIIDVKDICHIVDAKYKINNSESDINFDNKINNPKVNDIMKLYRDYCVISNLDKGIQKTYELILIYPKILNNIDNNNIVDDYYVEYSFLTNLKFHIKFYDIFNLIKLS